MSATSYLAPGLATYQTASESAETIISKVRQYLKSRRPFDSIPETDAEFFACALARLTWQPSTVLTPEVVELGRRDHAEWQRTGELPYYIVLWRELARVDIMHCIR